MRFTLSTHLLAYHPLEEGVIELIAQSPWSGLEIWLAEPHLPWRNKEAMLQTQASLSTFGLSVETVHLPLYPSIPALLERGERYSLIDPNSDIRNLSLEQTKLGLEAAAALQAKGAVLHLGWPKDEWTDEVRSFARHAMIDLLSYSQELGVQLLPENILSAGTSCAALHSLLAELDPDSRAGICFDIGHAHLSSNVFSEYDAAADRIQHLHIHDNDASSDAHLLPGAGNIPFDSFFAHLNSLGFKGTAALEIRDYSRGQTSPAELLHTLISSCGHAPFTNR